MSTVELSAIVRYERAAANVSALKKRIGEALQKCSVHEEMERAFKVPPYTANHLIDGTHVKTHLHNAFQETTSCASGYGDRRMTDDEIEVWLEEEGCPHCLEAWRLIGDRKAARKEFGIAKRAIRSIGKRAIKAEQEPTQ
jgi:hypothetical protein